VKDQIVVMGSVLEKMISAEKAEVDKVPAPVKEDPKKEAQTTAESSQEEQPIIVEPAKRSPTKSQIIKNKIHTLRNVVLEEVFPESKVSKEVQQKLLDAQKTVKEDLETVLVEDLKLISPDELKRRLVKLILEFKDRS